MAFKRTVGADLAGYGQQTALFTKPLAEHYDVAISSFYGVEGARLVWGGIPVLPGIGQDTGNLYLLEHARSHFGGDPRGGLVVTLMDVWVLHPDVVSKMNVASWTPVDHEPPIPPVIGYFKKSGVIPIAMSRFGEEQLKAYDLDPLYCPHGIDTDAFKPHDKQAIREEVGVPKDAFLVGMVAANKGNPSRKGFSQALQAFRVFREKHSEAILYLHTVTDPKIAAGEDLMAIAQALGIADAVVTAPPYRMMYDPFPPDSMAQLYSALDVFLNPSMGEGFGCPILEAQACGIPAIVTNFSSMPEVCGVGWHVGCRPYWTPGKSWQAVADVEEIVDALEQSYALGSNARKRMSEDARRHALKYSVGRVMEEFMLPALEQVALRFDQRAPTPSITRTDLATALK